MIEVHSGGQRSQPASKASLTNKPCRTAATKRPVSIRCTDVRRTHGCRDSALIRKGRSNLVLVCLGKDYAETSTGMERKRQRDEVFDDAKQSISHVF